MGRRRADLMVVEQGLAESRARAQALILAGAVVTAAEHRVDKPGELLDETTELHLKGQPLPYVSRGGLKLVAALDAFGVDPRGKVCLDVGASTGGFTDVLLQRGAAKVYAVDVGYGQLAWSLRGHPRVINIERANIRTLEASAVPEAIEVIVIDVSFISLSIVLPAALRFAPGPVQLVALVKPQFEVGRDDVGKGGIVRDAEAQERALRGVEKLALALGFVDVKTMDSPILGAKGNREFLLAGRRERAPEGPGVG